MSKDDNPLLNNSLAFVPATNRFNKDQFNEILGRNSRIKFQQVLGKQIDIWPQSLPPVTFSQVQANNASKAPTLLFGENDGNPLGFMIWDFDLAHLWVHMRLGGTDKYKFGKAEREISKMDEKILMTDSLDWIQLIKEAVLPMQIKGQWKALGQITSLALVGSIHPTETFLSIPVRIGLGDQEAEMFLFLKASLFA